jgi:putative CocE/NonD family hydrolase
MPDGVSLAADLYMPTNIELSDNVPVILEYTPYRKMESRGGRYKTYSYFAKHGYVVARVDARGTGNSEGHVIPYEYSDIELDDGEIIIDWLSKQEWSNGNVGMFGISWGGFNSIQMAVRNPPALKAFIALMATEALYQEDVHYIDGIMHTDSWMMSNDLNNSLPGAPEYKLDENWLKNRFEAEPSVYTYMRNQRDNSFWDRASSLDKYEQIKIPGFHIGGWYDGYRDSLPRMLENMNAPVKALIGPWDHDFPHNAAHSPQIEWRHEAVRWFDHWLKNIDTGIMDEPPLTVFVRDYHPPQSDIIDIPGKWRYEDGWPIERSQTQTLFAGPNNDLSSSQTETAIHKLNYKASSGLAGGGPVMWWGSVPPDQQSMDNDSLVYDSELLDEPIEILGMPRAILNVSADAIRANWVVRVSDVAPDGSVTQVGGAAFNGTHRNSAREPQSLVPGEEFPLEIEMHFTSWVFAKGHKIRFAVSNSMWPMLWPTPYPMTTTLEIGGDNGARLELPVIPFENRATPIFKTPKEDPSLEGFGFALNGTTYQFPWGIERFEEKLEHRTSDVNPAQTSVTGIYAVVKEVEGRTLRLEQDVEFKSDENNFRLIFIRRIKVNGELFHEKKWDEIIPRDFQ